MSGEGGGKSPILNPEAQGRNKKKFLEVCIMQCRRHSLLETHTGRTLQHRKFTKLNNTQKISQSELLVGAKVKCDSLSLELEQREGSLGNESPTPSVMAAENHVWHHCEHTDHEVLRYHQVRQKACCSDTEQPLFLFSQHLGKLVSWSSHILLCYIGLTQQNKLQGERRTTKFFFLLSDSLQLQTLPKHWQKASIWTATDHNEHILNLNVYQRGIQFQTVNHEVKKMDFLILVQFIFHMERKQEIVKQ